MQLDWMLVSKSYDEADAALMPALVAKQGIIVRIGDGGFFFEIWPSEPPEHLDDLTTLTLTADGVVVEERGGSRRTPCTGLSACSSDKAGASTATP